MPVYFIRGIFMEEVKKYDKGKPRIDLVQPAFIISVADVLTFGADKYAPNSWQKLDNAEDRYYAAAIRHLFAWRNGEKSDNESGLSHLAHAATNIMFLEYFDNKNLIFKTWVFEKGAATYKEDHRDKTDNSKSVIPTN